MFYPIFFIAKNNLKKQKGDMIIFFVLTLISALLMFSSASILAGTRKVMDTAHDAVHGADVQMFVNPAVEAVVEEAAHRRQELTEYETARIHLLITDYRNAADADWSNYTFFVGSFEEESRIATVRPEGTELGREDILLPYYVRGSFAIGDTFQLKLGEDVYDFHVAGYVQDPTFATPINISVYRIYLSDACMEQLETNHAALIMPRTEIKLRFQEGCSSLEMESILLQEIRSIAEEKKDPALANMEMTIVNWEAMRGGGSFMSNISMSVILLFAVLITLVALIIVSFSIRNFLERNMKNTGILEAAGYTTAQLGGAILLELELVAACGAVCGILLGILGNKAVGNIESMVLGLAWNQPISYPAACMTLLAVMAVVGLVAYRAGASYKRITVLDALRGGIHTHNFKKNHLPLEKNALPLPIALSCKELLGAKGKNLVLLGIVMILAISTCVGFGMYESFGKNTDLLLDMAGLEGGTAGVMGGTKEMYGELSAWDEIDTLILQNSDALYFVNGETKLQISSDAYNDPELLRHDMLIEGRFPRHDNEVVLSTNVAEELGVSVGDVVYVQRTEEQFDYIVSGIDQKINNMGRKAMFTTQGFERVMGEREKCNYYIYGEEGVTYGHLEQKIKESYPDAVVENTEQVISETTSTVANSMKLICIVLVAVTAAVVVLVEVLLIRSRVVRQWKNYGISKALGFTTSQLMWQTVWSNLPVVILGALVGTLLGDPVGSRLMVAALGMFGIKSVHVAYNLQWMLVTFGGIIAVALCTALLSAGSIRRVEPVTMLADE